MPFYSTVYGVVTSLDPQLLTLAHDGPAGLRDRYELIYRRQSERPNALWRADHTELDLLVVDANGAPARPWLTVVLDDCSRAVAGYTFVPGRAVGAEPLAGVAPRPCGARPTPAWAVYGVPDIVYVDHGSDFTSENVRQVAVDLHIELVHSAVARP